jgi:pyrroline-5-carboxylate reductase
LVSDHEVPPCAAQTGVTVGVIGTGNMGSALVKGWARALGPGARILVWDKVPAAVDRVAGCAGVAPATSLEQLAAETQFIIVVVKPKDGDDLLASLAAVLREDHSVISSMAGVEIERIRRAAGPKPRVFRVMPNLGVEVGAGMVAVSGEQGVDPQALQRVAGLFDALGMALVVPESMLDTVTAVSGTGPALLAMAVEALEDGGVAAGLPRATARMFARRAMLGAAQALTQGTASAGDLGAAIVPEGDALRAGVEVMEQRHVRRAYDEAVVAASERARQMRAPAPHS